MGTKSIHLWGVLIGCLSLIFPSSVHGDEDVSTCAVTVPDNSKITFKTPLDVGDFMQWHGNNDLTALIPRDGKWYFMGPEHNYRNKFWWAREGYNAYEEPNPELVITAKRLDAQAEIVRRDNATNAMGNNRGWHAMLTGMEFPSAGCWEVTGTYHEHSLTIVFLVGVRNDFMKEDQ